MKISFQLRDKSAKRPTPVIGFVNHGKIQVKIATGCSVHPRDWNPRTKRTRRDCMNGSVIDRVLSKMEADVARLATSVMENRTVLTGDMIRQALRPAPITAPTPATVTIFDLHSRFLEEARTRLQPPTIVDHEQTLKLLQSFEKTTGRTLVAADFTSGTMTGFENFLRQRNLSPATVWKASKNLRAFLRRVTEQGWSEVPASYRKVPLPTVRQSPKPYLTRDELESIRAVDLKGNRLLETARDAFLLQILTGLRFSDLAGLERSNVHPDCIRLTAQKTGGTLVIPLLPEAKTILEKYAHLPRLAVPKIGPMILRIREVAKLAGIDQPCQSVEFRGTERIESTSPKWSIISTHTARRTFIVLSLESGLRPEVVMAVTGHRKMQTMLKYVHLTPEIVADELKRAWDKNGKDT